ncbi:Ger(x)C family spore germination C-terminal domain-containing protein [Cohnella sp. AR92]|uniref:Ger(x)C family spore germination C-terminal domain-containing protein n=1 Tax=Cohnella sp. AR92 TaxID=648716 RepID=UPI000F8F7902|nr:Ger(x)C family spore germination C-terminal domain-containing protein [Cohnella sp. AR92]RUS47105.1 hypothetical protein ELR57_11970 [Cohnella sp. AR92]
MRRRGRRLGASAVWLFLCVWMTGCWDEVMIQDLHYITSLGFSYSEQSKEYEVFAQIVDLTAVAKKENTGDTKVTSSYGHETGKTPSLALARLFQTMQMDPNLDHVMSLIVDENALPHLNELMDGVNRISSIRYGIHVLGSKNPIGELFQMTGRIALSPLNTDIYQPNSNKRSLPFTTHNVMRDLVRSYKGCPCTVYIPALKLDESHWELSTGQRLRLPGFHGAFVIHKGKYAGQFDDKQLEGVNWFKGSTQGRFIPLEPQDQPSSVLAVKKSSGDYRFLQSPTPAMRLKLSVQAVMLEVDEKLTEHEIESKAVQSITDQIKTTLQLARSKGLDLFEFEDHIYRFHHRDWKKLNQRETEFDKLPVKIEVKVHLLHSGKIKLQKS